MFQYIGIGEILNIFVFPFLGLVMSLVWFIRHRREDSEREYGGRK